MSHKTLLQKVMHSCKELYLQGNKSFDKVEVAKKFIELWYYTKEIDIVRAMDRRMNDLVMIWLLSIKFLEKNNYYLTEHWKRVDTYRIHLWVTLVIRDNKESDVCKKASPDRKSRKSKENTIVKNECKDLNKCTNCNGKWYNTVFKWEWWYTDFGERKYVETKPLWIQKVPCSKCEVKSIAIDNFNKINNKVSKDLNNNILSLQNDLQDMIEKDIISKLKIIVKHINNSELTIYDFIDYLERQELQEESEYNKNFLFDLNFIKNNQHLEELKLLDKTVKEYTPQYKFSPIERAKALFH